ncbi:MAG TPA: DoxX family protein [Gemmatimonadaceae bacterium]|nr:DoxX family protein [Gemmatimonadaceae bacterium]
MSIFRPATTRQLDLGLTILRVVTGVIFAAHGGQKLFVYGFDGVAGAFAQMGIPMASIVGPLVALLEFAGGLALIAGLLTRVIAVGLAVTMVGAIFLVHISAGFFAPEGYEFNLALLGASLTLALTGAGALSVDGVLAGRSVATQRR